MTNRILPAGTISSQLEAIKPQIATRAVDLSFASFLSGLQAPEKRTFLNSMKGKLTWSVVGHLRNHMRNQLMFVPDAESTPTIDGYNDAINAIAELAENEANVYEQGFDDKPKSLDIAAALHVIRSFCSSESHALAEQEKLFLSFVPRASRDITYASTLQQMLAMPQLDEDKLKADAAAMRIEVDHLRRGELNRAMNNRAELMRQAPEIVNIISNWDNDATEEEADAAIESLPFPVRMKFMLQIIQAYDTAATNYAQRIARGDEVARGTYVALVSRKQEVLADIREYLKQHPIEVQQYSDMLPRFE